MPLDAAERPGLCRPRIAGWCLATAWLAAVLAGFAIVIDRDMTPGEAGTPHGQYPEESILPQAGERPTLVMFAHPRCPCTSASLSELRHILESCPGAVEVRIFFRTPAPASQEWMQTPLWEAAAALPETTVLADAEGAIARQCGAATSGHVLLYGSDGTLLYSGGITGSRGHEGDNPGRGAIVALLTRKPGALPQYATFGCPLFERETSAPGESCLVP